MEVVSKVVKKKEGQKLTKSKAPIYLFEEKLRKLKEEDERIKKEIDEIRFMY